MEAEARGAGVDGRDQDSKEAGTMDAPNAPNKTGSLDRHIGPTIGRASFDAEVFHRR